MEMSLLQPATPVDVTRRPRSAIRWALSRLRGYSHVQPPPTHASPAELALYGAAQPILGARILLSDFELLKESLFPAALLALACAAYASLSGDHHGKWAWARQFYQAFAALAPLPSVVFANHYARIAAIIRWRLGFGACGPREMPMGMLIGRLIRQTLIVAIGIAPLAGLLDIVPLAGPIVSTALLAAWGLHWVVADAFDDAQVCLPGESLRESIDRDRRAPSPWFVRWMNLAASKVPFGGGLIRRFARLCDKLALDSRGEIEILENNRSVSLGFGLSTAALLAIPGLNLLFRPIILASAAHLVGQIEFEEHQHHAPALAEHEEPR
jgi:hypothetical protein